VALGVRGVRGSRGVGSRGARDRRNTRRPQTLEAREAGGDWLAEAQREIIVLASGSLPLHLTITQFPLTITGRLAALAQHVPGRAALPLPDRQPQLHQDGEVLIRSLPRDSEPGLACAARERFALHQHSEHRLLALAQASLDRRRHA